MHLKVGVTNANEKLNNNDNNIKSRGSLNDETSSRVYEPLVCPQPHFTAKVHYEQSFAEKDVRQRLIERTVLLRTSRADYV